MKVLGQEISSFTAYPMHYIYNSKIRGEHQNRITDFDSTPQKNYKAKKKNVQKFNETKRDINQNKK